MDEDRKKKVDSLREACGTLPSKPVGQETKVFFGCEKLEVEMIDEPKNPYKAIFAMATATWGNDLYQNKWPRMNPINRYRVVLSTLQGKALPMGLEGPKYTFRVTGLPRHCFDQMARTRVGAAFGSIGSRDNCKLDTSFILYSQYRNMDDDFLDAIMHHFEIIKDLYFQVVNEEKESWQIARSFLPMCYHHPFHFNQNLLSLIMQSKRRLCFAEEEFICGLHWYIKNMFVVRGMRLIADFMRPACDSAKRCLNSKGDGSELFGQLFAGCRRWIRKGDENRDYCEFNKSCSDIDSLEDQLGFEIPEPNYYINYQPDEGSYRLLGSRDKYYFEED
ncbi:hypothetical protein LCGC14_0616680 [marine sediment metagenome]|uniref:Uncharacterized protein n=1 Tax=marine sediment metagenome TaxID=412755 RepID=A0A0F9TSB9_9ZZZZ